MAEENKAVRLSKVAKEVNVSTGNIREFLAKKGFEIDSNPNVKLTEEQYVLVLKEFQSDKAISEKAQELKLESVPKKNAAAAAEAEKAKPAETVAVADEPAESTENKELLIKTAEIGGTIKGTKTAKQTKQKAAPEVPAAAVEAPAKEEPAPEEKPEKTEKAAPEKNLEKVEKPEKTEKPGKAEKPEKTEKTEKSGKTEKAKVEEEKPAEETPAPQVEEKPEPPVETKPEEKPEPQEETKQEEKKTPAPAETEKSKVFGLHSEVVGPKILDTMDSETFRQAMAGKAVKAEEGTITKVNKIEDTPKPDEKAETDGSANKPRAAEDNFIKTEYQKISGPTVVGVVDLSKVMSTGGRNDRNGHRPVATTKSSGSGGGVKQPRKRIDNNKSAQPLSKPNLASRSDVGRPAKRNNGKKGQANKVVVVSDEEIKKKMQETMSRVHSSGNKTRSTRAQWIKEKQKEKERIEQEIEKENIEKKTLRVTEFVTVSELATMMNKPVTEIISTCMSLGLFVSINQRLSAEPISLLAEGFGFKVEFVDADVIHELESQDEEDAGEETPRTPIVTVMGHVDHGKTSLLDYIRKTNVIAGEAGGITQHIGAYEVQLEDGRKITFLDTPGHEAFTAMRARGAKMTDIAIIVVAADDRVMPQTVEAINHAQAAGVPIVFAINKVDKPGSDPERIKSELAEMNLLVEDWGGKYQSQDISAKNGTGVEALLEKVLLEAEMLDLKAHPERRGKGTVIESSLDKGRGYVAKILVQDGTVRIGDFILAGPTFGRVKAMYNERNQAMKEAGPSQPLLLLGLNGAPQPGDVFNVMADEREAKDIAGKRLQLQREQGMRAQKHITLDDIGRRIAIGNFKELNIIVKADVDGSVEALSDSLLKLSTPEVQVNVIHKSVGQITESDIMLAAASEAIIVGFQVRPSVAARKLAENEKIDIRLYSIIYDAINELKDAIEGMLSPVIQEKIVANLEIREVFKISKVGSIAGCIVLDGRLGRNTKIRIIRDGIVVYTGELGSLRRFKDDVKEVAVGQDCGLNIKNFNDIKVGDIIEGYEQVEIKRTL